MNFVQILSCWMLTHLTLNKKGVTTFVARRVSSCVRTFTESGSAWGLGRGSFSPATAAPATTLLRADPSTPRSVSTDETVPGGTAPELVRKPRDTSCRHPYCLVLRSRPMQASVPPEQGHPHRCRRPSRWTRPSRSMHPRPKVRTCHRCPQAWGAEAHSSPGCRRATPRPSAPGRSPAFLLLRDSTASEPISQQVLPVFYTWHWVSCTRADGVWGPGGDLGSRHPVSSDHGAHL